MLGGQGSGVFRGWGELQGLGELQSWGQLSPASKLATLALATGVGVGCYTWWKRRWQWIEVGVVSHIYLHPLKCGRGQEVQRVSCTVQGPRLQDSDMRDRGFMVVKDKDGELSYAGPREGVLRVVLVTLQESEGGWRLEAPDTSPCDFESPPSDQELVCVKLLDISFPAQDCGSDTAAWLSAALGGNFRLVKYQEGEGAARIARPKYQKLYPVIVDACVPIFADVTPYLITSEASLNHLNSRLQGQQLEHRTFRPNFVVSGDSLAPWQEDTWSGQVKIGQTVFTFNKPCTRCQSTRVDPNTGLQYTGGEPLTTLKQFRQHDKARVALRRVVGDSPLFGMHYSLARAGTVAKGDKVWVRACGRAADII